MTLITIEISGVRDALRFFKDLNNRIKDKAVIGMHDGSAPIADQINEMGDKEYVVETDVQSMTTYIIPSTREYPEEEVKRRKAVFMWRAFRCPYWKYIKPMKKAGWVSREDLESILSSNRDNLVNNVYTRIKEILRGS